MRVEHWRRRRVGKASGMSPIRLAARPDRPAADLHVACQQRQVVDRIEDHIFPARRNGGCRAMDPGAAVPDRTTSWTIATDPDFLMAVGDRARNTSFVAVAHQGPAALTERCPACRTLSERMHRQWPLQRFAVIARSRSPMLSRWPRLRRTSALPSCGIALPGGH